VWFNEMFCILSLLKIVPIFVFYHPLEPLCTGFEDTYQHCFVNLAENFSDPLQEYWQL
jgi:hypothetical protein